MKRTILYILCVILVLGSFVACENNNKAETQTDAPKTPAVIDKTQTAETEPEQLEDATEKEATDTIQEEKEQEPPVEQKTEEVEQPSASNPDEDKPESVVPPVENETDSPESSNNKTENNPPSDLTVSGQITWPSFTTFAALETWLRTGEGNDPENVYDTLIENTTHNADFVGGYYYRPTLGNGNDFADLLQIEVCSNQDGSTTYYRYDFSETNRKKDLTIWCEMDGNETERYWSSEYQAINVSEEHRPYQQYSVTTYNGVEYYAFYYAAHDHTYIYWRQEKRGKAFCADVYGYFDRLDQILPLLTMERVSYATNSDHVTQ